MVEMGAIKFPAQRGQMWVCILADLIKEGSIVIGRTNAEHPWRTLLACEDTDAGNAEAFAHLHGHGFRYDHIRGKWMLWTGNHWVEDEKDKARDVMLEAVRERRMAAASLSNRTEANKRVDWALASESTARITAALRAATSIEAIATITPEYDRDPCLFTCGNGTLDLHTGWLRASLAEDLITRATPVNYIPGAKCPRWLRFLGEVFGQDQELIEFVWLAVGYSLTGDTSEQCLFILLGEGANGKSTFLEVLLGLLGSHAITAPFATFLVQHNTGSPRNDIAALYGARLVKAAESQQRASLDEAVIKEITGGDRVTARFLYSEQFTFHPQFKLWLATNHLPRIRGTDEAIWRRIRLIEFKQRFEGASLDRRLPQKLKVELPGILAWAVEGCLRWQKTELGIPKAVVEATNLYREESDILGRFIDEECVVGKQHSVGGNDLYMSYRRWSGGNNEEAVSSSIFSNDLLRRGIRKARVGKGVVYHGLKLSDSAGAFGPSIKPRHFGL